MSSHPSPPPNRPRIFAFTIRASAEPETVPRLISPFAKRGMVPRRFSARAGQDPGWMTVWVEADLPDTPTAQALAETLRGVLCVDAVLMEETRTLPKRRARAFGAFAAG